MVSQGGGHFYDSGWILCGGLDLVRGCWILRGIEKYFSDDQCLLFTMYRLTNVLPILALDGCTVCCTGSVDSFNGLGWVG